ncbi:MAG TPA: hypothetical protein ENJ45_01730, partial [Phaeodactylibacter sp.]|nr:hypothetical protein [Phaeodactylibacter sp.]
MKKPTYAFIFLTVFLFSFSNLFSQVVADSTKSSQRVLIKMLDGDEFIGHIISQDDKTIVLNTSNGKMKLIASKIKSVEVYEYEGRFKFPNPHDTRYYFGPSGIPLGKREGYYQNLMLFGNFVNYGITDFLSIGGGFEFLSTVNGNPILFFTPKVGFNVAKKFHLGGGLMVLGVTDGGIGTLGYGVATYGSSETNLSLGIGYGGAEGEVFEKPAIMV